MPLKKLAIFASNAEVVAFKKTLTKFGIGKVERVATIPLSETAQLTQDRRQRFDFEVPPVKTSRLFKVYWNASDKFFTKMSVGRGASNFVRRFGIYFLGRERLQSILSSQAENRIWEEIGKYRDTILKAELSRRTAKKRGK